MFEGKDLQTVVGYLSPVKQGVNYPFNKYLTADIETSRHNFPRVICFSPAKHGDEMKKYARQKLAVKMKNISMSPGFTEKQEVKVKPLLAVK